MGNALLYKCELDPVLRELAIIRVGRLSRAAYEVFQHERIGREVGVTEDKIAALRDATIEAPPSPTTRRPCCASPTTWCATSRRRTRR